ncbi:MAG TPA: heavy metal-associated domain-containing protein [Planctomycetota bacterium]
MLCLLLALSGVEGFTHRVTGLFSKEREADLREAVKKIPDLELKSIDFDRAEATFEYDPAKFFKGVKEKDQVERFNNLLRQASSHTFGIRANGDVAWDKLTLVEIPVAGLDCRACELSAYEVIYKIEGVEQATASFKAGRVTARVDPAKTSRDALIEALKKRQVAIKAP